MIYLIGRSLKRLRLCSQHIKNTSQVKDTVTGMELMEQSRVGFKGETGTGRCQGVLAWVEESQSS